MTKNILNLVYHKNYETPCFDMYASWNEYLGFYIQFLDDTSNQLYEFDMDTLTLYVHPDIPTSKLVDIIHYILTDIYNDSTEFEVKMSTYKLF